MERIRNSGVRSQESECPAALPSAITERKWTGGIAIVDCFFKKPPFPLRVKEK
jgi:hypothetical protein